MGSNLQSKTVSPISSGPMSETMGERPSDYSQSKKVLLDSVMNQYGITENDLHDLSTVRAKMRDVRITEITK